MTLTSRLHAGHVMYLNHDLASFNVIPDRGMISVCWQCLQMNGCCCFTVFSFPPELHTCPTDDHELYPVRVLGQGLLAGIIPPIGASDSYLMDALCVQEDGACLPERRARYQRGQGTELGSTQLIGPGTLRLHLQADDSLSCIDGGNGAYDGSHFTL